MQLITGYEDRKSRIEIVPLIDVVFLLLVFFIYAMLSMTVHRGLRVDLPSASGVIEDIEKVVIVIAPDNTLRLDEQVFSRDALIAEVSRRSRDREDLVVLISGDRRADLGGAVELLSGLRQAGVESVSFHVEAPR